MIATAQLQVLLDVLQLDHDLRRPSPHRVLAVLERYGWSARRLN